MKIVEKNGRVLLGMVVSALGLVVGFLVGPVQAEEAGKCKANTVACTAYVNGQSTSGTCSGGDSPCKCVYDGGSQNQSACNAPSEMPIPEEPAN